MTNDNNNLTSKIDLMYIGHVLENDFECTAIHAEYFNISKCINIQVQHTREIITHVHN